MTTRENNIRKLVNLVHKTANGFGVLAYTFPIGAYARILIKQFPQLKIVDTRVKEYTVPASTSLVLRDKDNNEIEIRCDANKLWYTIGGDSHKSESRPFPIVVDTTKEKSINVETDIVLDGQNFGAHVEAYTYDENKILFARKQKLVDKQLKEMTVEIARSYKSVSLIHGLRFSLPPLGVEFVQEINKAAIRGEDVSSVVRNWYQNQRIKFVK